MKMLLILLLGFFANAAFAEADPLAVAEIDQCFAETRGTGQARDCIGVLSGRCMETPDGQTTVGMMFCMGDEADAWDVLLNREYGKARETAKSMDQSDAEVSSDFATRAKDLLAAQRAWIVYRDANCLAAYGFYGGGSMRQIAGAQCRLSMTAERTFELRDIYDVEY